MPSFGQAKAFVVAHDSRFDYTSLCPALPFYGDEERRFFLFHTSKWKRDNSVYSPSNHLDAPLIAFSLFELCTLYRIKLLLHARS